MYITYSQKLFVKGYRHSPNIFTILLNLFLLSPFIVITCFFLSVVILCKMF